ncbi:hypothetical protein Gohar_002613 [Gossypium harknessii]|uniref:Uncharacterized protein n=1 Tax=Gossypium harknessii TaxID=34285 RepID=A0A7J9HLM2_9ROSI|nr:hypothetical protein [Gossypium harknessii]
MMLCKLLPNFLFIERKRVEVWCAVPFLLDGVLLLTLSLLLGESSPSLLRILTPEKVKIALSSFLDTSMSCKLFYMWLAQHIFSRCFYYRISLAIVLVAIKIAQGRYKILSYVNISFIQIYFWERFSACAQPPSPGPLNIVPIRLLIGDSASLIGRAFALL